MAEQCGPGTIDDAYRSPAQEGGAVDRDGKAAGLDTSTYGYQGNHWVQSQDKGRSASAGQRRCSFVK